MAGAARIRVVRRGVLVKCGHRDEAVGRLLNVPNTLHTTLAAGLFFIAPAMQNLDVVFQGLNTWHSFQYLAVVIFLNRLCQARGTIGSATLARFASRGGGVYAVGIGMTAAFGVLYLAPRGLVLLIDASGRPAAAALLVLLRLRPVRPPHPLLLRPLPVPPHRRHSSPPRTWLRTSPLPRHRPTTPIPRIPRIPRLRRLPDASRCDNLASECSCEPWLLPPSQ